ncbi:MAG: helix-turn-helix transcriptional regulator [Firmicutes bacterium]|nr:helix-turn-helix transcriptional regulator [Bacillota bacterium]
MLKQKTGTTISPLLSIIARSILHCQREVYRRYEKGIRELPLSYAIILADYYKVSLDYLVGRSKNK